MHEPVTRREQGGAPMLTRHADMAPAPVDQLELIGSVVRLLRADQDLLLSMEQALSQAQRALALQSAQIVRSEASAAHAIVATGRAQAPAPNELAACVRAPEGWILNNHVLWVRLAGNSNTCWLLGFRRESGATFAEHEVRLATVLSSILAGYLDNLHLISELRDAEEDALRALAESLASRDRYTGAHVDAVCTYAERLGERLGLDEQELRVLRMGSILHDIGKVGVNDAILQKSGPLTESEMMLMRQHTIMGAQIVRKVRRLQPALPIVLYHHERWDGGGYPTGMAGDQIPLGARIVAVVDSFHAMTSTRPYRPAHSYAEALAELRRCAGTHFDPRIVAAFVELIEETDGAHATTAASPR